MQGIAETVRALTVTDFGVAIITVLLVFDRVVAGVAKLKGNGKVKDETKEYKILHPCKDDPKFLKAFAIADRSEPAHDALKEGIGKLVIEATLQTRILGQIEKNGKMT